MKRESLLLLRAIVRPRKVKTLLPSGVFLLKSSPFEPFPEKHPSTLPMRLDGQTQQECHQHRLPAPSYTRNFSFGIFLRTHKVRLDKRKGHDFRILTLPT